MCYVKFNTKTFENLAIDIKVAPLLGRAREVSGCHGSGEVGQSARGVSGGFGAPRMRLLGRRRWEGVIQSHFRYSGPGISFNIVMISAFRLNLSFTLISHIVQVLQRLGKKNLFYGEYGNFPHSFTGSKII